MTFRITTTIEAFSTEEYKEAVKSLHDQVVKEAQKVPEYKFSDTEEKKASKLYGLDLRHRTIRTWSTSRAY
nr:hypothetical protein [Enterococcus innesii]